MSEEQQNGSDVSDGEETEDELTPERAHELKEQGDRQHLREISSQSLTSSYSAHVRL